MYRECVPSAEDIAFLQAIERASRAVIASRFMVPANLLTDSPQSHEVWGDLQPRLIGQWPPLTDELREDIVVRPGEQKE